MDKSLDLFCSILSRETGLTFPTSRYSFVENRLAPLLEKYDCSNPNELIIKAKQDLKLRIDIINTLTTNETWFFRHPEHFEILKENVFPQIIKTKSNKIINIWSAGCSTGAELYSILITAKESIPESELQKILEYKAFKSSQLSEWMSRPARQQVKDTRKETAYIEGNYDYNIWYDKYLTDRKEEKEKIPAEHKCIPSLDTGYTRADKQEKIGSSYFCLFFAKGCCSEGVNCRYYHRVPTFEECEKIENSRDIFGRSRFYSPLKDNGGIGVFTKECRTIYVYDLKKVETKNPVKDMVRIIYENFSPWGEIENINYIHVKSACYIKYSHRCSAEFAKEAMMRQSLVGEEILSIKWAYNETDPELKKIREREEENLFVGAVQKKAVEYQESNVDYAQEKYLKLKEVFKTIEENKKNDFDGD